MRLALDYTASPAELKRAQNAGTPESGFTDMITVTFARPLEWIRSEATGKRDWSTLYGQRDVLRFFFYDEALAAAFLIMFGPQLTPVEIRFGAPGEGGQMIHYIDALCGAGKTYALARLAHRYALQGRRVLMVQPSIQLIEATVRDELSALSPAVSHRIIHSTSHPGRVHAETIAHMRSPASGGEILFLTHAAFLGLAYVPRREEWTVVIDEIPSVDVHEVFNLTQNHALLIPALESDPYDTRYAIIRPVYPQGETHFRKIAENKSGDDVWKIFQPFAARLMSEHWTSFALDYQLQNLACGHGEKNQLITYSLMRPSILEGYAKVILAGACIRDSLLYRLWVAEGVAFREFSVPLRYTRHANGELITICYALEGGWSKHLRDRDTGGVRIGDRIAVAAIDTLAGEPFVYMANKDEADPFGGMGTRLPNSPFGLNEYQDHHAVVVMSALNAPPAHFSFLAARGVDPEEVKDAGMRQTVYQAANRISIRNPRDRNPKTVIVPDRMTADWLADKFEGARVQRLDGFEFEAKTRKAPGRVATGRTSAERKLDQRRRDQLCKLRELDLVNGLDFARSAYPLLNSVENAPKAEASRCHNITYMLRSYRDIAFQPNEERTHPIRHKADSMGSVFADIYSKDTFADIAHESDNDFILELREFWKLSYRDKKDVALISPAIFDADKSDETNRGLDNITYLRGIWLDNDGGDLSHEDFARFFPRLRVVVMNTFRSRPDAVRWRAFVPTTLAMPISVHRGILDAMLQVLNLEGYWSEDQLKKNSKIKSRRTHGFDLSKLTASSLFYLPAQAEVPENSFFIDHNDALRGPIDPYEWAQRCIPIARPEPERPAAPPVLTVAKGRDPRMDALRAKLRATMAADPHPDHRGSRVSRALEQWRADGSRPGNGHVGLFTLAAALARAGLDACEVRDHLYEEASRSSSPAERRREIKGLIASLERKGGFKV